MANVMEKYVNEFKATHGKKNVFTAAMCVLLFFVALAVAWQLKITGISLAGDENISDPKADVETSAQWEATLPQLSDDWKENVSSIALSQLDYAESTKNFVMSDDEKTRKGYTRYGAWFGSEYNDWDALFASFCLEYAGVKKESFPHSVGAQTWIVELQKTQQFVDVASATPQKGDLIFFDTNNDKRANTVGVIVDINEAKDFVVVQGDLDDRVQKTVIASTDPSIMGFGVVPQNPEVIAALEREKAQAEEQARAEALQAEENQKESDSEDTNNSDSQSSGSDDAPQAESDTNTGDSSTASSAEESTPTTSVVVRAEWNEGEPPVDSITVHLIAQGDIDNPLGTMTISSANDWEGVFRNLAVHDSDGKVIEYRVVEDLISGYESTCEVSTISAQEVPEVEDLAATGALSPLRKKRSLSSPSSNDAFTASPLALTSNVSSFEAVAAEGSDPTALATLLVLSHMRSEAATSSLRANGDPTIPVTITKEWSDGAAAHANDSVTVRLTENGQEREIVLNAQNNWTITVAASSADVTLTEDAVEGYETAITRSDSVWEYWVPVTRLQAGATYAIVYDWNQALTETNYNYLGASEVSVINRAGVVNGYRYSNYLTNVPETAQWSCISTDDLGYSGYFGFQNVYTGNFIRKPSDLGYCMTDPSNLVPLAYSTSGKLFMPGYYYLYTTGVVTDYEAAATNYTLYQKVNEPASIDFSVVNRKSVGRNESGTTINLKKEWNDSGANHDPVTVRLFGEDGREVQGCPPVTLSEENGWEVPEAWRNLPERTYTIQEDSVPGYYSQVEGVQTRNTIWVPVEDFESDGVYALVDNENTLISTQTMGNYGLNYFSAPEAQYGTTDMVLNGQTYAAGTYLKSVPSVSQWTASYQTGGDYALRSSYINITDGSWLTHGWSSDTSSYIMSCYPGDYSPTHHYKMIDGEKLYDTTMSAYVGPLYSYSSSAYTYYSLSYSVYSPFKLYKQITVTDRDFIITNTPQEAVQKPDVDIVNKKYIDALRDSDQHPNPDTELPVGTDLADLYRLYLDVTPNSVEQPIDVLIVLDDSGSMGDPTSYAGTTVTRTEALNDILGGSSGLINRFLQLNPNNNISIVKFAGSSTVEGGIYSSDYLDDASVVCDWTDYWTTYDDQALTDSLESSGGTDYSAALLQASELFDNDTTGNRKIMLFLSDGVPTFYVGGTDTWGVGGTRYGNGSAEIGNVTYCLEPSKDSFDAFKAQHPDVTTYTIGFSEDIAGGTENVSMSPAVLRYYAEEGSGEFIQAATADILEEQLMNLLMSGGSYLNVGIADKLSSAVDLYDEQPDYKLVKETLNEDGSIASTTVMWEGGQPTPDGEGKVEQVVYDEETKTVRAVFAPDYALDVNNRYTLSFNVKVTQEAYNTYATNRSNGDEGGYGNNAGDPETDYRPYEGLLEGVTSSELPGFNSNEGASLTFKHNGFTYDRGYVDPVIQVSECSLELLKVDKQDPNKVLSDAKFSLYRRAFPQETGGVSLEGETGTFICINDSIVTGADGKALVEHLSPGEYYLVETEAPQGFTVLKDPEQIVLTRGSLIVAPNDSYTSLGPNDKGAMVLQVNNSQSFALPKTGAGGLVPLAVVGSVAMIGSCAFGCVFKRRHRERRFVGTSK